MTRTPAQRKKYQEDLILRRNIAHNREIMNPYAFRKWINWKQGSEPARLEFQRLLMKKQVFT